MSNITKQDTNGVKPLLGVGEFGYDNYPAGGDVGRVFVGTGSANIALAKKSEVDTAVATTNAHTVRVDNPHAVTKAQVGLSNADNTSDNVKNVLSATKWTTARTITLNGDVSGSVSVDGSANVTITTSVQPNSIALGTDTSGNYVAGLTQGTGISVTGTAGEGWSPTVSLTNVGTAGTYRSVTTDAQGRVIAGTNPTTVNGYGLTDVYTKTEVNSLIPTTLPASDVYAWAKASTKPEYTASEVGLGNVTNESKSTMFNNPTFTGTPIAPTAAADTSTTQLATTAFVQETVGNKAVVLTGDQTIAGIKTFSSSPIVPTPTTNTQAANKVYVDAKYSGFKNYIINGNFNVWQRGTSFSAVGYCADRWHLAIGGSANATKHNVFPNTVLMTTTAASSFANLYQAIETATVIGLRGKTLTLSLKLQTGGTYTGGFILSARYSSSTDTLNSQTTDIQSLGVSASSTNTRYSLTFTVPADAVGLRIDIENTSVQPSGALYQVQEVQLEEGSVATPFEQRPYGLELSLCQRYLPSLKQATFCIHSQAVSSTVARFVYIPIVQPRVPPTGLLITSGNGVTQILNADGVGIGTSAPSTIWFSSVNGIVFTGTVASGLTAGDACLGNIENILFTGCEL